MNNGVKTIIYPVKDLAKAKELFSKLLGSGPTSDAPYYVGFENSGQQIGLDPGGHSRGMTGAAPFWQVDDIEKADQELTAAGASTNQAVTDVGGGRRIATLKDADGNLIGLMQDS